MPSTELLPTCSGKEMQSEKPTLAATEYTGMHTPVTGLSVCTPQSSHIEILTTKVIRR